MPGIDGTGPLGLGPISGRGLGMCVTGVNALRYGSRRLPGRGPGLGLTPGIGRGLGLGLVSGLGRGLARGLGYGAILGIGYGCARAYGRYATANKDIECEKELLQQQKERLKTRLDSINKKLEGLQPSTEPAIEHNDE